MKIPFHIFAYFYYFPQAAVTNYYTFFFFLHMCSVVSHSFFVTLWSADHQAPQSMGFSSGKNTGAGHHFLLPTQGVNTYL